MLQLIDMHRIQFILIRVEGGVACTIFRPLIDRLLFHIKVCLARLIVQMKERRPEIRTAVNRHSK